MISHLSSSRALPGLLSAAFQDLESELIEEASLSHDNGDTLCQTVNHLTLNLPVVITSPMKVKEVCQFFLATSAFRKNTDIRAFNDS